MDSLTNDAMLSILDFCGDPGQTSKYTEKKEK